MLSYPGYRGCALGSGRSFVLGEAEGKCPSTSCGPAIGRLTLAGTIVAFERSGTTEANPSIGFEGTAEWFVVVRDLRNGRTLRTLPTGVLAPARNGYVGVGPTTDIVVKPDGAVAWIADSSRETGRYEVHAADQNGSRLLAVSSSIDRSSLALAGSTLYWSENGLPFSTQLN